MLPKFPHTMSLVAPCLAAPRGHGAQADPFPPGLLPQGDSSPAVGLAEGAQRSQKQPPVPFLLISLKIQLPKLSLALLVQHRAMAERATPRGSGCLLH